MRYKHEGGKETRQDQETRGFLPWRQPNPLLSHCKYTLIAFRVHGDKPGWSPYLKSLNFVTPAMSLLPCKVTHSQVLGTGMRRRHLAGDTLQPLAVASDKSVRIILVRVILCSTLYPKTSTMKNEREHLGDNAFTHLIFVSLCDPYRRYYSHVTDEGNKAQRS